MVRLTLIARLSDGLPLAEGLDSEKDPEIDQYKVQAKVRRGTTSLAMTYMLRTCCTGGAWGAGPKGRSRGALPSFRGCTLLPLLAELSSCRAQAATPCTS